MDLVRSLQRGRKKHPEMERRGRPKLERRNAVKNIVYEAGESAESRDFRTRSLEISPSSSSASPPPSMSFASQKSFRIDGEVDGDVSSLFRSLGVGPEDFAITFADLEAAGMVSSPSAGNDAKEKEEAEISLPGRSTPNATVCGDAGKKSSEENSGGIKGPRPPKLLPPPSMSMPSHDHNSTWDLFHGLARAENELKIKSSDSEAEQEDDDEDEEEEEEEDDESGIADQEKEMRPDVLPDLAVSCSSSTSSGCNSPSSIVEGAYYISANAKLKRKMVYWEKGKRLGSGSFGTVFEGISNNGFFFAIKEVSLLDGGPNAQQCISQLEQEIALLSQFEHDNIVEYYGTDKADSYLYIFLELVTQGSLANLYHNYKLGDSQVSVYTRQILSGLKYLHERGVVHRDIKCANILVDASGSVKLADFGLAKQTSKFTEIKSSKGSVYWMAPEVVRPTGSYGPPADIWSLGCTVLEMLTGQLPYPNQEWTQVMFNVGKGGQPEIPPSLSRDARDFIQQCVQKKPADRPTAAELLEHPFAMRPLRGNAGSNSSSHGRSRRSHISSMGQ